MSHYYGDSCVGGHLVPKRFRIGKRGELIPDPRGKVCEYEAVRLIIESLAMQLGPDGSLVIRCTNTEDCACSSCGGGNVGQQ